MVVNKLRDFIDLRFSTFYCNQFSLTLAMGFDYLRVSYFGYILDYLLFLESLKIHKNFLEFQICKSSLFRKKYRRKYNSENY